MTYYEALQEAMDDAREQSFLPTALTRAQMLTAIEDITRMLKGSMSDGERIILCADRQELRLRLRRAEEIAQRLLGKSNASST